MAKSTEMKSLYGGQIAPPKVVLKGMTGLERELTKLHNEQESRRAGEWQEASISSRASSRCRT
jgi:hypothetical protein